MSKFIESKNGIRIPLDLYGKFGISTFFPKEFLSFKEARKIVRSLRLKNQEEWKKYCKSGKRPDNIPANPYKIYKDKGWKGVGDFLGTKR